MTKPLNDIEHLKAVVLRVAEAWVQKCDTCRALEAEVVRLREEADNVRTTLRREMIVGDEVARLQAQRMALRESCEIRGVALERAEKHAERLLVALEDIAALAIDRLTDYLEEDDLAVCSDTIRRLDRLRRDAVKPAESSR